MKRKKLENAIAATKVTMDAIVRATPKDSNGNVTRNEYNLLVKAIQQVQDQIVGLHKLVKKDSEPNTLVAASSLQQKAAKELNSVKRAKHSCCCVVSSAKGCKRT